MRRGSWKEHSQQENTGYMRTRLWIDGQGRNEYVHVLVARAFFGAKPESAEVRHLDGDRKNNHVENLSYGSSSRNSYDAVIHGTHNMARKTHCKRGHEFTETNTSLVQLKTGSVARRCKACSRLRAENYRNRKRREKQRAKEDA